MSAVTVIMKKFWDICAIKDNKLHASQTEPEGIKRICNLAYAEDNDHYHLLDVYYPEGTTAPLPVIIDIHGGGWMYADKELNKIYCLNLAKRGFTVFNISYRLVPDVTVNEQLIDAALALRWIKAHLGDYPCDENNIMLTGDSAGGMLAFYSAALASSEELRKIFDTCDPGISFSCLLLTSAVTFMESAGIMSIYTHEMWGKNRLSKKTAGFMDADSLFEKAKFPPTCLITSSGDILGLTQTRRLAGEFKKRSLHFKLLDYPRFEGKNLPHVFSVLEPESNAGRDAIDKAIGFYRSTIKTEAAK